DSDGKSDLDLVSIERHRELPCLTSQYTPRRSCAAPSAQACPARRAITSRAHRRLPLWGVYLWPETPEPPPRGGQYSNNRAQTDRGRLRASSPGLPWLWHRLPPPRVDGLRLPAQRSPRANSQNRGSARSVWNVRIPQSLAAIWRRGPHGRPDRRYRTPF